MSKLRVELKPLATEKAVMAIERENVLTFSANKESTKQGIKKEVEETFDVKVDKVRTNIRHGKKYVYVKLKNKFPAIDVATKLGLI